VLQREGGNSKGMVVPRLPCSWRDRGVTRTHAEKRRWARRRALATQARSRHGCCFCCCRWCCSRFDSPPQTLVHQSVVSVVRQRGAGGGEGEGGKGGSREGSGGLHAWLHADPPHQNSHEKSLGEKLVKSVIESASGEADSKFHLRRACSRRGTPGGNAGCFPGSRAPCAGHGRPVASRADAHGSRQQ
jgi:hypothetical protein